jgi:hypothetical protein
LAQLDFSAISASDHSLRSFITARRILLTQRIPRSIALPKSLIDLSQCPPSHSGTPRSKCGARVEQEMKEAAN